MTTASLAPPPPAVRAFVQQYVAGSGVDSDVSREIRYSARTVSLGGRRATIVYVIGPEICGTGGCPVLVLVPHGKSYAIIGDISISRPPIEVLPTRHHGLPDLAVFVAGGGILPGYEAVVPFNGAHYAENPSVPPAYRLRGPQGRVVIGPDDAESPVF